MLSRHLAAVFGSAPRSRGLFLSESHLSLVFRCSFCVVWEILCEFSRELAVFAAPGVPRASFSPLLPGAEFPKWYVTPWIRRTPQNLASHEAPTCECISRTPVRQRRPSRACTSARPPST
ncbi:hypothetical protein AV530_007932 [Patagioenas fasciata monilis]|uniref:Uncharacterized protein n=1 Tax=Patagioenas fasciata monilis TaxID=372326 RepID=A0A1V4K9T1_PATFA|nr:hypothetical protein AV530_007932 [Patagioenas fasciata monilis]